MTTLASLSSDILELILSSNDVSYMVIALWKVGNRRLNALIANSCTLVDLQDLKWNSTSRFPKMLRNLRRLKSLRVDRRRERFMDSEELGFELQRLSPSLESLELSCAEAESCLLLPALEDLNHLFTLENDGTYSYEPVPSETTKPSGTRLWNIGLIFPRLHSLKLSSNRASLVASDMLELPKTLTRLSLPCGHHFDAETQSRDFFASVPRGLLSLELGDDEWKKEDIRELPPNLTELLAANFAHSEPDLIADQLSALPRSLTNLDSSHGLLLPFQPDIVQRLPPLLKKVFFRIVEGKHTFDMNNGMLSSLPPTLTTLILISARVATNEFGKWYLAALPKTITKLEFTRLDWCVNWPNPQFPPRLQQLIIGEAHNWTPEHWQSLPQNGTLHTLDFVYNPSLLPVSAFALFPRSLTKLKISGRFSPKESFHGIPEKLTSLHLPEAAFSPSVIRHLPRSLKSIQMCLNQYTSREEAKHWPPRLEQMLISMRMNKKRQPSKASSKSPASVVLAPFHIPSTVVEFSMKLMTSYHLTKDDFNALPRTLKVLLLAGYPGGDISFGADSLEALPPSLTDFTCDILPSSGSPPSNSASSSEVPSDSRSDYLQHLPATLEKLVLRTPTIHHKHLLMLPKSLSMLSLISENEVVLQDCFPSSLPPHLEQFKVSPQLSTRMKSKFRSHSSRIDAQMLQTPDPRVFERK